jgi:paraquat-inducible protein B
MKKANPTALGLFVVVGMVLAVGAVFLFSSRTLFHPHVKIIAYFDGSLKGLNPGAPVKFRGVTIGKVDQILIRHNQAEGDFAMPVITSIDIEAAQAKSDQHLKFHNPDEFRERIEGGLRARLDSESIVTGVLYVGVDFFPKAGPPTFHQIKREYIEIPTMPSQVQQLWSNLERVDLPALAARAHGLLEHVDDKLAQFDVAQLNSGLTNLLGSANQIVGKADVTNAIVAARLALDDARKLLIHVDMRVDPLADSLTNTLASAQHALSEARRTLGTASDLIGSDSALRSDLADALQELSNASRSVADLADFVKRNPDSLIRGRKPPKESR